MKTKTTIFIIIGALILVLIGLFNIISSINHTGRYDHTTRGRIQSLHLALVSYYMDNNTFPESNDSLEFLLVKEYLLDKNALIDQWGNPFIFEPWSADKKAGFKLISYGADAREGGMGENEDIIVELNF